MKKALKKFRSYWLRDISFIMLLVMLVFSIFILPSLLESSGDVYKHQNTMFMIIFFTGIWSASNLRLIILSSILFSAGLLVNALAISGLENDFMFEEKVVYSLNTIVFIIINLKLLFRDKEFNLERVLGAVNVYFLLALLGAFLFEIIHIIFGTSIQGDFQFTGTNKDFAHYIYFSFVSITTLGFGDIVPINQAAKMLSVFLSTIGVLFPAVVIARLVSLSEK